MTHQPVGAAGALHDATITAGTAVAAPGSPPYPLVVLELIIIDPDGQETTLPAFGMTPDVAYALAYELAAGAATAQATLDRIRRSN